MSLVPIVQVCSSMNVINVHSSCMTVVIKLVADFKSVSQSDIDKQTKQVHYSLVLSMMTASRSSFVGLTVKEDEREKKISLIFSFLSFAKTSLRWREISGLFTRVYARSHFHRAFLLFLANISWYSSIENKYLNINYSFGYYLQIWILSIIFLNSIRHWL